MKNKMTAGEAAEILNRLANNDYVDYDNALGAMRYAASILRRVASGKLAEVVHAHWEKVRFSRDIIACSSCGTYFQEIQMAHKDHCPKCGALMDGKDDNHAEK